MGRTISTNKLYRIPVAELRQLVDEAKRRCHGGAGVVRTVERMCHENKDAQFIFVSRRQFDSLRNYTR